MIGDIPSAAGLVKENYGVEFAEIAAREMYSAIKGVFPQPIYFVAISGIYIVGLIGVSESAMNFRIFEVFWVNVKPSHQRIGIGKRLVLKALNYAFVNGSAESVLLTAKEALLPFYSSVGFIPRGIIGHDNFDDNLMEAKPPLLAVRG